MGEGDCGNGKVIIVREFNCGDSLEVQRIFREGMMEMIPDTAFRGLCHHPESQLLYGLLCFLCFLTTRSLMITCCMPALILCARYYCSKRVVHECMEHALSSDMGDIDKHYMKSPDTRFWVAVLGEHVVGMVAAHIHRGGGIELLRMSVDQRYRRRGIAMVLGRRVLQFARQRAHFMSASCVVLGTTSYTPAAHQLYRSLGFRCVGVTEGYSMTGTGRSLLQRAFYRVRHHHYQLDINTN
ncbi:N-acetylaspartate synthetase-like [Chanos chanos]|uniref:N-acetylaspartate synthetase n=1 Tax=Chanos chanos TaxID=29144 RepID=A0A6J2WA60_CHACN|nr:N-acetylaspartate synthetase-like [Chanos chanos]